MTRAVLPRDFGGPDQLELVECDTPRPAEGEVLVAGVTGVVAGDEVVVSDIPGNGYAEHVVAPASGLLP